jgi:hypothetical protein
MQESTHRRRRLSMERTNFHMLPGKVERNVLKDRHHCLNCTSKCVKKKVIIQCIHYLFSKCLDIYDSSGKHLRTFDTDSLNLLFPMRVAFSTSDKRLEVYVMGKIERPLHVLTVRELNTLLNFPPFRQVVPLDCRAVLRKPEFGPHNRRSGGSRGKVPGTDGIHQSGVSFAI